MPSLGLGTTLARGGALSKNRYFYEMNHNCSIDWDGYTSEWHIPVVSEKERKGPISTEAEGVMYYCMLPYKAKFCKIALRSEDVNITTLQTLPIELTIKIHSQADNNDDYALPFTEQQSGTIFWGWSDTSRTDSSQDHYHELPTELMTNSDHIYQQHDLVKLTLTHNQAGTHGDFGTSSKDWSIVTLWEWIGVD